MIKKRNLIFFLIFSLSISCSLDNKTGIWSGSKKEKKRISDLEYDQKQVLDVTKIYSSENIFSKIILLNQPIKLSEPIKNSSWEMPGLNHQNFLGNIYLPNVDNTFLKKNIGKNMFSLSKIMSSPLIYKNNIIFSDDKGTIFNINQSGSVKWKKNIYKKLYKNIYKNLSFSIFQDVIYIADNIGFVYAISFTSGELIWLKNHGIPIKSKIKIFKNRIFLINQDNRIFCLKTSDGSKVWDIRTINSFIKNQNLLSLAISKNGDVVFINSAGDLIKANAPNGNISWSLNISGSMYEHATDFFKSSNIVILNEDVIFSAGSSFFSYNLNSGKLNWIQEVTAVDTPIINGKNIFSITGNGYFIIMNKETGEIISSSNILKLLKKKKQKTKISGYVMGSGKIYSVTANGFLIVSSAISGKPEYFKKIGDPIISSPIITNGSLYLLTENSKIFGLN